MLNRRRRSALLALLLLPLALCALTPSLAAADVPRGKPQYESGPDGRVVMGGRWLFRFDGGVGMKNRFQRQRSSAGWKPVEVPNAWNVGDDSARSMTGTAAWYRKDFTLPSSSRSLDWIARFESVNYRARFWLNGKPIGTHKGAYLPFELRLNGVKRRGVNRLVVRIDNRRHPTDFPPSGLTAEGSPTGGWWNYGGILREVYLRRVNTVDWDQVRVRPQLGCASCPARVESRVILRNSTSRSRKIRLTGRFGDRALRFGTQTIPAGATRTFYKTVRIDKPKLWQPESPNLYNVSLTASRGGRKVAGYRLKTGIRTIKVSGGKLVLNGRVLNFRGVGLHEDTREKGLAIGPEDRELIVREAKDLGATLMRAHYPLHPRMQELADEQGLLIWSEIPVYAIKTQYLKEESVRRLAAEELRANIEANQHHPSVIVWSLGNELSARPGPVQGAYIKRASRLAREIDPTRPVGLAVAAYPGVGCQPEYQPLSVIGINEYYGWYPGPGGLTFDRERLSPYLDSVRHCYPKKAIVMTEFGAEANRDGPVEEKGTYAFQNDFIGYHLGVAASKPWLSGAVYWALREFRVRPNWDGGNPRPTPPIHQKGVIRYDNTRKPGYAELQRLFKSTQQIAPAR